MARRPLEGKQIFKFCIFWRVFHYNKPTNLIVVELYAVYNRAGPSSRIGKKMPEVSDIEKCRAKRKVAKASVTRNINRVRELISSDGSVSKVRQFAKGVEEGRTKARDLTKELEELDPASIETDGDWLEQVEFDVCEILGEVAEFLSKSESPPPNGQSSSSTIPPTAENNEGTETVNNSMSGKRTGLKGVEIPSFDGKADKWPYFWGIFSSLVHKNDN